MSNNDDDKKLEEILNEYSELPIYVEGTDVTVHTRAILGDYPIHTATIRQAFEEVQILISYGADVNAVGEFGYTPLHWAVQFQNIEIAKLLLEKGASTSIKNVDGDTPLETAYGPGKDEFMALLQMCLTQNNN